MKIGILSQWYDPEPGPAAIPGVLAREFAAAGHEVHVLTGFPNYPTGRLYAGFRQRLRSTTTSDGVTVTRVPLWTSHDSSALGRVLNYASFALSATVAGARTISRCDVVWVYNSPVTVALPLLVHTRGGRIPYFLHVQDLWPDSLIESGMFPGGRIGRVAIAAIRRLVALTERRARRVGVISPSVVDLVLERNPRMRREGLEYVPNPTDEALFTPQAVRTRTAGEPLTVMYTGAVGEVQGLEGVIRAVAASDSDVRLLLVGDGIALPRLRALVDDLATDRVEFLGRVPKEQVPELMARADVHLVSLATSEFLAHTTPSKIASLLASAVPVLGVIAGDGARLIDDSGAGVTAAPGDDASLRRALDGLGSLSSEELHSRGEAGRRYYDRHLSARTAASTIVSSLLTTATTTPSKDHS